MLPRALLLAALIGSSQIVAACSAQSHDPAGPDSEVVVYASVDQNYSEPVLDAFEEETGIRVRAVYDVEAAKTTGLVNRLLAERTHPVADVWWSGEFAQTIELAGKGVLAPHKSRSAAGIPAAYASPDGLWTGFGGRARVLLVNTDVLAPDEYPVSIFDLADASVDPGRIGMAFPVFGTTATHAAALYAVLGDVEAREYFEQLRERGIKILDGNAQVRDQVVNGQLAFGMTDTDDACGALARGAPVEIIFPDQEYGSMGTLIVPNTVALVDGAPNEGAAKALIDYLLSEKTAIDLLESGWFQLTLRPIEGATGCVDTAGVRGLDVSLTEVASRIEQVKSEMADTFVR
jgi:iron(III) transport system substrate-binding protein